jgi:hypothetical protein
MLLVITCLGPLPLWPQEALVRQTLDSGTVLRLHLQDARMEKGKLLTPFTPDDTIFHYCRYPAPPCAVGDNRYVERPAWDVSSVDIRSGTRIWWGVGIGVPIGLAWSYMTVGLIEYGRETNVGTGEAIRITLLSTAVWAGLGALIGAGIDVWKPAR